MCRKRTPVSKDVERKPGRARWRAAQHIIIALVIYSPALRAFHRALANPDVSKRVGQFSKAGLEMAACGNTMKSQNGTVNELLPGFVVADKGGVVRIAELQSQGYLYLRP